MLNEVIVDTLAQPQEEYLHVLLIKDILELIFRLLPVHDLLEVRFTCKFWLQTSCCRNYKFQQQVCALITFLRSLPASLSALWYSTQ